MGLKVNRKVYRLKWPEGHDLHGLEIDAYSPPIGQLLEMGRLAGVVQSAQKTGGVPLDEVNTLLDTFVAHVKRWNLEDEDGAHVAEDRAGLELLNLEQVLEAVLAWARAVSQVPGPLGRPSTPSGIPKIPMEPLTAAHAS